VAESLNSFDSRLDQGGTFGVEPELVYERLQTDTQSVKEISSVALLAEADWHLTLLQIHSAALLAEALGTADKPQTHV